jgi:hypothetical protein
MQLLKLQFRPGINTDLTSYSNEGGWRNGDKIRFREGFPESIGGWEKFSNSTFLGTCRSLHPWVALDGTQYLGVGTHLKFYIARGADYFDVTPIRATTSAGDVTFSATTGSSTVEVSDTAHGALVGDFVTFSGAVSLGGNVTAAILNAEYQITAIIDADTYEIAVSVTANASDTGNGGAAVIGAYQINSGLDGSVLGSGWGADPWGAGGWGSPASTTLSGAQLRIWSQDNFGEDLLMNVHDGGIYYWDASGGLGARAVALSSLVGSQTAPTIAKKILVSDRDRHVLAFGCDGEFSIGTQDPLLIRFSDQESLLEWRSLPDTTAGSLRIGSGSEIVTAVETKQQVLVFTDVSVHTMQYLGPPFTFGVAEVATGTSIIGQNAAVAVNDTVYWMGSGDFYIYDGTVRPLQCPVSDYVFDDFNYAQASKVSAGLNADYSEIWWFYPCSQTEECTRYVVYDYGQNIWHFGTLDRTAWLARGVFGYPLAAGSDNTLYYHEIGVNDGSTNPPSAISSFAESSEFDLDDGYRYMFVSKIIPDVTFRGSEGSPQATITLTARNFPGSPLGDDESGVVARTATVPVEQYTEQNFVRLRGRSIRFKIEANQYNTAWKLGSPRLGVRPDGRK